MRLEGQTIIVTGGASGLGGATVDMIVAAGGLAVIVDINEQAGVAKAAQHGKSAHFVTTDVTSDAEMQRAIDAARTAFGAVHGLVCAAGMVAERSSQRSSRSALNDHHNPTARSTRFAWRRAMLATSRTRTARRESRWRQSRARQTWQAYSTSGASSASRWRASLAHRHASWRLPQP